MVRGGEVVILEGAANRPILSTGVPRFGRLWVTGNVDWTGGVYRPVVHATQGSLALDPDLQVFFWKPGEYADWWTSTGTFSIGGQAQIAPGAVDNLGVRNAQQPKKDEKWIVLTGAPLVVAPNTPTMLPPRAPTPNPWTGVGPRPGAPNDLIIMT